MQSIDILYKASIEWLTQGRYMLFDVSISYLISMILSYPISHLSSVFFVCLSSNVSVSCGSIILDIFSYSGPSGMLGSNRKHTSA